MEKNKIQDLIEERQRVLNLVKQDEAFYTFVDLLSKNISSRKGTIYVGGNGGSFAQAGHLVSELVGRYKKERPAFKAVHLGSAGGTLTAVANDYSYGEVFMREVEQAAPSDTFVVFSTSGNSENVLRALLSCDATRFAVLGKGGGEIAVQEAADEIYIVPSYDTGIIQEVTNILIHMVMEVVES